MKVASFGGQTYSQAQAAKPAPGAPQEAAPSAQSSPGKSPQFGCLIESTVGCCALPVLGIAGFAAYKGIKGLAGKTGNNKHPKSQSSRPQSFGFQPGYPKA